MPKLIKCANGQKVLLRRATFFINSVRKFKPEKWNEIISHAEAYTVDAKNKRERGSSSSSSMSEAMKETFDDPNRDFVMESD